MKQKILFISLICCMVAFSACSNEPSDHAQGMEVAQEVQKESESLFEVTINSVEKAKDWEDKDCVVINYTFTNNCGENIDFRSAVNNYVFQNGVEQLSTVLVMSGDAIDNDNSTKTIQTGTTIECQRAYLIEDNSDVTIEVYDFYNEFGDVKIAEKTFELE